MIKIINASFNNTISSLGNKEFKFKFDSILPNINKFISTSEVNDVKGFLNSFEDLLTSNISQEESKNEFSEDKKNKFYMYALRRITMKRCIECFLFFIIIYLYC